MSEQQAEETRGESGSVGAGSTVSHSSEAPAEAAAALAVSVLESPAIAPDHEASPKADMRKPDTPKADAPKVEAPKFEVPKPEMPRATGKVLIMAPSDRAWHDHSASAEVKSDTRSAAAAPVAPKRGFLATAAMLALAVIAGAIGGAVATTGFIHVADAAAPPPGTGALEASIARIDADVVALKAGLDHTSKQGVTQFSKTNDRLDKIEKAQAEPAAKLARLTEAVDKLRAAPAATPLPCRLAAASAAPKDSHGLDHAAGGRCCHAGACRVAGRRNAAEARSGTAAERRGLVADRCRLWRGGDPESPRNLRSLCRRLRSRPRPHRCDPQAGRPMGGRHQQGPDRSALS